MTRRTHRRVARFSYNCSVCNERILKNDCVCIMLGTPSVSHKKCEPAMIAHEEARMKRIANAAAVDGEMVLQSV